MEYKESKSLKFKNKSNAVFYFYSSILHVIIALTENENVKCEKTRKTKKNQIWLKERRTKQKQKLPVKPRLCCCRR